MLSPGVALGHRYELEERVGAGGFSEVWRARDLTLGRPVAVKVLHAGYVADAEALARFRAEARHAGSLAHENIARIYDYGEPDQPYLVMELVHGPSLAEVLASGPMDPARAMDVLAQTAAGLQAAHGAGLVHRDIKPGNLLLAPDGIVKITDFGIAHAVGSAGVTSTGLVVGTPAYLAPERVAGASATAVSAECTAGIGAQPCRQPVRWPAPSGRRGTGDRPTGRTWIGAASQPATPAGGHQRGGRRGYRRPGFGRGEDRRPLGLRAIRRQPRHRARPARRRARPGRRRPPSSPSMSTATRWWASPSALWCASFAGRG